MTTAPVDDHITPAGDGDGDEYEGELVLYYFEGLPVTRVGIEVPDVAGGLREAIEVDNRWFPQGDRKAIVLDSTNFKVRHDPVYKDRPRGPQRRVEIWKTVGGTIIDRDLVAAPLDAQQARVNEAREESERLKREKDGTPHMTDDEKFRLAEAHAKGEHGELVEGCEVCDDERAAVDAEARADATEAGDGDRHKPDWGPGSDTD